MEYIIVERDGREKWYIEEFNDGHTYMTPDRSEAKLFGLTEANRILQKHEYSSNMHIEEETGAN